MKAVKISRARFIVLVLVTGTIGLLLLMHATSAAPLNSSCCAKEACELGLIKLI